MALAYAVSLLAVGLAVAHWLPAGSQTETRAVWGPVDGGGPRARADGRLPDALRPTYYRIRLMPFLEEGNFTAAGEVWIWLNCTKATDTVTLNTNDMVVSPTEAQVVELPEQAEEGGAPAGVEVAIAGHRTDAQMQMHSLLLERALEPGRRYALRLAFTARLNDLLQGFYRSSYVDEETGETRWLASTQFCPTDARRAFPCFDEPAFKARFQISLARPARLASLSNMPLEASEPVEGMPGWWWDHYPPTLPMSTYLVAFMVSDLQGRTAEAQREEDPLFRVWARPAATAQAQYAARVGPAALRFLESYFDIAFPLPKQDMVAVPDFGFSAMENWGLITFRESAMLFDPNSSTEANKEQIAYVIGHEISHQWFGNLVTPAWWNDVWLKEGFATYIGYKTIAHVEPTWREEEKFVVKILQNVFAADALESSHTVSVPVEHPEQISQIFDTISYQKGASLVRMMNHFLGEETFRTALTNYLEKYKYRNARQDDLWEELTLQAHQDGSLPSHVTVAKIMDTWTLQTGFPVVTVERDYDKKTATISQHLFLLSSQTYDAKNSVDVTWWVPLTYTTADTADFNTTRPRLWLENTPSIDIEDLPERDSWVLFNIQAAGYYRVNYDIRNWQLLTSAFPYLPEVTRSQLVDDAFNLARAGHLPYPVALDLLKPLSNDDGYLPWAAASPALNYLREQLALSSAYGNFKVVILRTINIIYSKLDFEEQPSDSHIEKLNRINILKLACSLGHEQCVWHARAKFRLWMSQDSRKITTNPISPNQKSVVYCTAIKHGGNDEWDFAWRKYQTVNVGSEKEQLLDALGCSSQPWLLNRYLNWMLSNESGIRKQDGARVFEAVAKNVMGHSLAFNFLRNNWEDLQDYYGGAFSTVSKMVSSLSTYMNIQLQLKELEEFRDENAGNLGTTEQSFEQTIEKVKANIRWMDQSYADVEEWLKKYATF